MTKTVYRLLWAERGNPDNSGEGLPMADAKKANEICRWHNQNYPMYRHYVEKGVFTFEHD